MFGMGMPEILLILAIALVVIGPKKLPDLAKSMGRAMREFKKATSELKESMEIDTELGDVKKAFNEMSQDIKESVDVTGGKSKPSDKPPTPPGGQAADPPPASDPPPAADASTKEGPKQDG